MVALIHDVRSRSRRGISTPNFPDLIVLSPYAFFACEAGTGNNPSPDANRLPANYSGQSESVDLHLYPENGEHLDRRADSGEHQPIQDITDGVAEPLPVGLADAPSVGSLDLPLTPDGNRNGLLSPACHGSPDPHCGPTNMYVG